MTRAARTVLAALALALALAAPAVAGGAGPRAGTAPGSAPARGPEPAPAKRLLVVSDSTLAGIPANGALDDLRAALPGWEVTFDAHAYRNTAQGVDVVAAHDPTRFGVVVVGLGANDAWSTANFSVQMERMVTLLAPVPRVYWLTLRESPRFQQAFAPVNAAIRLRAAATPHLEVADWNGFGAEHPEAFYSDGLHLTPAGGGEAARFITSLVERTNPHLEAEPTEPREGSPTGAVTTPSSVAETRPRDAAATPIPATTERDRRPGSGPSPWGIGVTIGVVVLAGAVAIAVSRRRRSAAETVEPAAHEHADPRRLVAPDGTESVSEWADGSEPAIR